MTDIAPELIEEIRTKFQTAMMKDRELNQVLAAINNGSISCSDALTYADKIGAALQEAVGEVLSADVLPDGVMYYNIAERLVNEVYGDAFDLAEDASEQVMKSINDSAGIGLKVQASGSRKERLSEIIESIAGREYSGRTVTDFLSTTRSCPMNAAQDTFAANAEFQSSVGRSPKIVRTVHLGACEECIGLAGEHNYPGVSKRVFWRHGSCRCTVEYYPGNGTVQNAHTKQWTQASGTDKIEKRRAFGQNTAKSIREGVTRVRNSDLKNGLPIEGEPDSIVDKIDDFGNALQRRIYGDDGLALIDFDTSDHGEPWIHPTGAHKHIWDQSTGKNPRRQKPTGLTEQELKENSDIIRRGENYHDEK